jgi:jumonji domain-containing protein 7
VLSDAPVHVAQTPDGLADAIATLPSGERVFAKPFETVMPFSIFACELCTPLMDEDGVQRRPVLYASHQNSSLSDEYRPLWDDLDLSLEWADEAFGKKPAAVNFWMGEDAARTSVHADLFDNLYVVVRGEKCFTLLPPQEGQLLRREPVRAATYVPVPNSRGKSPSVGLELQVDDDAEAVVYWATVALDSEDAAPLQPMRAVLGPGELLVLPSLWWHHVSQRARSDDGGRCSATVAVNYWYDNG